MSWIRTAPDSSALGPLFEQMRARSTHHRVAELWRTCALDPRGLAALFGETRALMDDAAPLSPAQAELIATVVSATNGCGYCVAHHGPGPDALEQHVLSDKLAVALDEALQHCEGLRRQANFGRAPPQRCVVGIEPKRREAQRP